MTKKECAIIMAYTNINMLEGTDFANYYIRYAEEKLGHSLTTFDLANRNTIEQLKEASKEDFIALCKTATDGLKPRMELGYRSQLLVDYFDWLTEDKKTQ